MIRAELIALWMLAAGLRLLQIAFEPAYLHPDALYQGLEPAFRAVYGHGVVSWEFKEGLRSWVWPGLLAAPFAVLHALGLAGPGQGMAWSVALARLLPVLIDLLGLGVAMGLVRRVSTTPAVRFVGWVGALHPAFVIMAAQPLIDVPAATLLLSLLSVAQRSEPMNTGSDDSRRVAGAPYQPTRSWLLGALAAATVLLRIQLAPAVAVVAALWLWRHRAHVRRDPKATLLGPALAASAVVLAWGGLDWLTWGAPWHTFRAYLAYNLGQGQTAFGAMAADRYWAHFGDAVPVLRWLSLPLLLLGSRRVPWLACAFVAIALPHQLLPYKVWRFLHPALWLWLCLTGVGVAELFAQLAASRGASRSRRVAALVAVVTTAACGFAWHDAGVWRTTWLYHQGGDEAVRRSRGLNRATLVASRLPRIRRVVQAVLPEAAAPGHALLGHDAAVLHPLGARVPRGALLDRDVWFVVDGPDVHARPAGGRLLMRDWDSGVAVFQVTDNAQ